MQNLWGAPPASQQNIEMSESSSEKSESENENDEQMEV